MKYPSRLLHLLVFINGGLLVMLLLSIYAQSNGFKLFVNSDTLYLPSIYLDLFVHGTGFKGWRLNISPNFFPDMITYLGMMSILKDTALTSFVYSILQFSAGMVLLYYMIKSWAPDTSVEMHILLGLFMLLLLVGPIGGEDPLIVYQLLVASFHGGFFINTLLAMIVAMNYFKTGRISWLVLTGVISILATLSDRLFLISFVFPMVILTLLSVLRNYREYRYSILLGVTVLSAALGMFILQALTWGSNLYIISAGSKTYNFSNIGPSFQALVEYFRSLLGEPVQRWIIIMTVLFLLVAPIYLLRHLVSFIRDRLNLEKKQHFMLLLFLWASSMAMLFTPVINGSFLGSAHIRFCYPGVLLSSLGALFMLLIHLKHARRFLPATRVISLIGSLAIVVLIIVGGIRHQALKGIRAYLDFYPVSSQSLDQLKESHGLTYGIANYWHAKQATIYSRNDIRLYAVHNENLKPYYHVNNENWYHDGGKGNYADPVFNFIYADEGYNNVELLLEIFGDNLDTIFSTGIKHVIKLPPFKYDRATRDFVILDQPQIE